MKRHHCDAARTIFVPKDSTIRKACIVPNHEKPHNHPILPATKASRDIKDLFNKCIDAVGVVGTTVRSVENGELIFSMYYSTHYSCLDDVQRLAPKIF